MEQPVPLLWTTYDPLDLASGSLDPLGVALDYLALADRFLPSFTTVTTIPRYVSKAPCVIVCQGDIFTRGCGMSASGCDS